MVAQLNTIAHLWWQWMGGMFWQVGLLIILVTAIDMAIRRWAWPQVRYVLWGLVFIKLVIPPTWQMPTSIVSWLQPLIEKRISIQIEPREETTDVFLEMEDSSPSLNPAKISGLSGRLSMKSGLFLGWIGGVVAFGFILIRKMFQLRNRYRYRSADRDSGMEIPDWFRELLSETAQRLKLRKSPAVVFSGNIVSPAVYGLFRPVLLLPEGFFNKLSREEAEHVLIHELCHLKRGDLWVHWFCLVLQMLYWFNPLLIWTRRRMRHVCEICCDLSVANILREKTRFYRDTLIRTAKELFTETVEPGLGFLGVFEEPFRIVPRLQWLEKKTWEKRKRKAFSTIITSLAMIVFVMPMAGISQSVVQNQDILVQNDPKPLKIVAQEMRRNGESVFLTGNVTISFESITIDADNAMISVQENFDTNRQLPPESLENLEANGHVRVEFETGIATSEKAVYDGKTNKLVLSGEPEVTNGDDTISGDIIEIDIVTQKAAVRGNAKVMVSSALPADGVYEMANIDEPPQLILTIPPKYPPAAKAEKIEGRIVVELVVTKEGTSRDEWVIDAEPPDIFEEAALDAIRQYKFTPGRRNGEAVDVKVKLPIHFAMDEPGQDIELNPEAKGLVGAVYNLIEVDGPPRVMRVFPPEYPMIAKEEQIEGKVILRFVVDTDGRAQEPEVVMASPYGIFDESALDVVKRYQFKPALMNGLPVNCIVKMPIRYSLDIEKNNQTTLEPEKVPSFYFNNDNMVSFINFVGDLTGKRFVTDDDVKEKVSVSSLMSISVDELNGIFQSVLDVNGLEAVHTGESIRIKKKDL